MEPFYTGTRDELADGRNRFAAVLSLIPGLGHIYKAHYLMGAGHLLVGIPVVLAATALLLLATFGLSLLLPIIYIVLTGAHAYTLDDRQWHPRMGR